MSSDVVGTNCNILHEQGVEKVVLGLLESAADKPVLCCASCSAITTMGSQLATSKQLIGKEGDFICLLYENSGWCVYVKVVLAVLLNY